MQKLGTLVFWQVASQFAWATILVTPLPKYLSEPCCTICTHCLGWQEAAVAERLCSALADLWAVTDNWLLGQPGPHLRQVHVLCPHLELTRDLPSKEQQRLAHLRSLFREDGVQLTGRAYDQLADVIWRLVRRQIKQRTQQ
jgi:hypothetical protein